MRRHVTNPVERSDPSRKNAPTDIFFFLFFLPGHTTHNIKHHFNRFKKERGKQCVSLDMRTWS
ncbi:unnamed protein product [Brassica rapa subsp. trilocularis]